MGTHRLDDRLQRLIDYAERWKEPDEKRSIPFDWELYMGEELKEVREYWKDICREEGRHVDLEYAFNRYINRGRAEEFEHRFHQRHPNMEGPR